MPKHPIFTTAFSKVYPFYVQKAERKNRTRAEVDQIICWLTGYDQAGLQRQIEQGEYKQYKAPFRWLVPAPRRRRHLRAAFAFAH